MSKRRHRVCAGSGFVPGRRAAATLLLAASCLAGAVACRPSSAAANPPPAESIVAVPPVERPKPVRESIAEPGPAVPRNVVEYVLDFEPRANPFATPESARLANDQTGREVWTADVKLNGLMTSESGMMAAVSIDGKLHVARVGSSFRSERGAGELRIVEIRASDIVVEQGGVKRIVSLPRP